MASGYLLYEIRFHITEAAEQNVGGNGLINKKCSRVSMNETMNVEEIGVCVISRYCLLIESVDELIGQLMEALTKLDGGQ